MISTRYIRPWLPALALPILALSLLAPACKRDDPDRDQDREAAKANEADRKAKTDDRRMSEREPAPAPEADAMPLDPKVEKAVELANAVGAEPGRVDEILGDAGMDRAGFQRLLYEIAHDPELSKSYSIARDA